MGKWLERARRLEEAAKAEDNRDAGDKSPDPEVNVPIVPNVPASLPAAIRMGLRSLRSMPVPPITLPEVWPEIVRDALALAAEGWAQTAISLGWLPEQIWGAAEETPGLCVWLAGRQILVLDEGTCVVRSGPGAYAVYHRRDMPDAVLLWELGERGNGR